MKKYLVTGGCGFIGSNFIKYMLEKYSDILIVNLDICSYAGNLENLADIEKDSRYIFVKGDIVDSELVKELFEKYDFTNVINFAAESHVDRSIKNPELFVKTNVLGTVNLLQRAKEHWLIGDDELLIEEDGNWRDVSKELSFFLEWQNPDSIHSPISLKMLFYAIVDSLKHDSWKTFGSYQEHSIKISEIAQHYSEKAIQKEQDSIQKQLNKVIFEDLKS